MDIIYIQGGNKNYLVPSESEELAWVRLVKRQSMGWIDVRENIN